MLTTVEIKVKLKEKKIKKVFLRDLYNQMNKKRTVISDIAGNIFTRSIKGTAEWLSLKDSMNRSSLMGHLGIDKNHATTILESILETWSYSFYTIVLLTPEEVVVNITGVRQDYSDVLNLPEASFISMNGHHVPWLRWLLLEADTVQLPQYRYKPARAGFVPPNSRSGLGNMAGPRNWISGWSLRSDPTTSPFAVSEQDNFVNRVIESQQFTDIIIGEVLNVML